MDVKQIATLVNSITSEISGEIGVLEEDLSNVVEVGDSLQNVGGLDKYVRALPNVIGKMVFVSRRYSGSAPSVLMDGWEFGSILAKIRGEMPEAQENESWELEDGASYDMGIFTKPVVHAKFFNKLVTFEIPLSITERQVKQSFHSATELNGFIDMLYNEVDKSMTVKIDSLIMRTINNFIATTVYTELNGDYTDSGIKAVNLLALYNELHTGDEIYDNAIALQTPEFLRFAVYTIGLYRERLTKISTLFNLGGTQKFTPADMQKLILLADFEKSAKVNLFNANGQFKIDNLDMGAYDVVPYWQGSGQEYALGEVSEINVKTAGGDTVDITGVVGFLFDRDALAVCNKDRRVTTAPYNAKGEFWNYWHKFDCEYINDFDENGVVFFMYAEEE